MKDSYKSYYRFRGSWSGVYEKLIETVKSRKNLRFSIWKSRMNRGAHILVVYGVLPTARMMMDCGLVELDHEDIAEFVNHSELYRICGFTEIKNQHSSINTYCFFVPRNK